MCEERLLAHAQPCSSADTRLNLPFLLQADGLQANIVTFNTLIDAMGKAGRWQDAIGVLDIIDQQVWPYATSHAGSDISDTVILRNVLLSWAWADAVDTILRGDRHALHIECPVAS